MNFEQAKSLTQDLRGRFDAPFSSYDKNTIEQLYFEVLGKEFKPTSCQQCYHDALIEIYVYLKKIGKMKEKCNYRMRAGFIINCPTFHNGKVYTNDNLTDEVAAEYLKQFPKNVDMFQQVPIATTKKATAPKVEDKKNVEDKGTELEPAEGATDTTGTAGGEGTETGGDNPEEQPATGDNLTDEVAAEENNGGEGEKKPDNAPKDSGAGKSKATARKRNTGKNSKK